MRKMTTRLAIALLTFSFGIVTAGLWASLRFRQTEEVSTLKSTVTEARMVLDDLDGWKKIDVEGKFSFYLPPNMEEMTPPNIPEADRVFRRRKTSEDESLYLYYTYGRRASCDKDADFSNKEISQKSEIVIGGKRAKLNVWQTERAKYFSNLSLLPEMTLCFPDVGQSKGKLYLYTSARNLEALEVARQIFNSIKFH